MRKSWRNNFFLIVALVLTLVSCGSGDHAEHADTYTCPMHPTVLSDRPSTCPVCGMDLVRKARAGEEVEITEDLARLIKSPNEIVVANIKTIKGQYKSVPVSVEVQGVVTYDTRNIYTIPSRVGGRLERVLLKYEYQPVRKGDKIAEIYSPELLTAQRELLFLLENDSESKALVEAAKKRLELLGLTSSQVNDLTSRKETTQTFSIYSPYTGYLITGQSAPTTSGTVTTAATSGSGGMSDGMASTTSASTPAVNPTPGGDAEPIVREGTYVNAGQTLFSIVNTNDLRIELDLPASQAGTINNGDKLNIDYGNGSVIDATIDFIQPFFNEGQDFVKLRVFTNSTGQLHIGHLVTATIQLPASESLWIPREALLDLGTDKIIFIKDRGVLKPKKVSTGISSNGLVQITSGLASSDEIAANAQYLVDSESFIKTTN